MKAYFRADVISVLADYPCYYWVARRDRSSAGSRKYDWFSYCGYVRDILDVVEEHTEPGPFRDGLLAHWYRGKGLRMLNSSMASPDENKARIHFEALRRLTEERFPRSVDDHLSHMGRIHSALLRAGDFDRYRALAKALRGVRVNEQLEYLRAGDGTLEARVVATLTYGDGSPIAIDERDGRAIWRPRVPLGDAVPATALDFTGSTPRVDVIARRRPTHETLRLPGRTERLPRGHRGASQVGGIRTARLYPETADRGRPMQLGTWELDVQVSAGGWSARRRLSSVPSRPGSETARQVVPFASAHGEAKLVAIPPTSRAWRLEARRAKQARRTPAARPRAGLVPQAVRRTLARVPGARAAARRLRATAQRLSRP